MIFDLSACVQPYTPLCTPRTCAAQNIECGPAGDGCGNGGPVRKLPERDVVRRRGPGQVRDERSCASPRAARARTSRAAGRRRVRQQSCSAATAPPARSAASTRPGSAGRRRSELTPAPHAAVGGMSGARRPRTRQTGCPSSRGGHPRDGVATRGRDTARGPPAGRSRADAAGRPPAPPGSRVPSDGRSPTHRTAPARTPASSRRTARQHRGATRKVSPGEACPLAGRAAAPWCHAKGEPRRGVSSRGTGWSAVVRRER